MININKLVLIVPLLISLCSNSSYILSNDNVLSTDQIITHEDREFNLFNAEYGDIVSYFKKVSGVYEWPVDFEEIFKNAPEAVLLEIATRIHKTKIPFCVYYRKIWAKIDQINTSMKILHKHVEPIAKKKRSADEEKNLENIDNLFSKFYDLKSDITFFAEFLEYHQTYFYAHEFIEDLRKKYKSYFGFNGGSVESNMLPYEINFVDYLESDIVQLQEHIDRLTDKYESEKRYAITKRDQLIFMKNVIVRDQRYQERLHKDEKEVLQREALKNQKNTDFDRMNEIIEQNKLLA